jgi:uncharacterized repeat protein (TIGR03803 family)
MFRHLTPHSLVIRTIALLVLTTPTFFVLVANAGERTLHTFVKSSDGVEWGGEVGVSSNAGLVADSTGNLYGTTEYGGNYGYGVVFELSRTGKGYWVEKILHNFGDAPGDGIEPLGGLIFDAAGNLYGTTIGGGTSAYGDGGTVFELTPGRNGNWKEKLLYSFEAYDTGTAYFPRSGLVMDAAGNLYGSTQDGSGAYGEGAVFEISPSASGWTESIVYSFGANQTDGTIPTSPYLSLDAAGNLYGVTFYGGTYNVGTVYQLSPNSGGQWTENILYSFTGGADGEYPYSTVTVDPDGNLFGATEISLDARGTVYEISPTSSGWSEQTIYTFDGILGGEAIFLTLTLDPAGNLYGVSQVGGTSNRGQVWELSPTSSGAWIPTALFSFDQTNGSQPRTGVIRDAVGNLYGVTFNGGQLSCGPYQGCGVAFEITP